MKKKHISKGILLGLIGIIIGMSVIMGFVLTNALPNEFDFVRENWGLDVPQNASIAKLYEKDSGSSFHGDGVRYYVYSYENENVIKDMVSWSDKEQATWLYESYHEAANAWLGEIEAAKEYYPEYEKCVYWYKAKEQDSRNEMIVFWNKEAEQIYLVMSLFQRYF